MHFDDTGDFDPDAGFPLGDGTAETESVVYCPYCGEAVSIALDPGGGQVQEYVEDCEVCCKPWAVTVRYTGGHAEVSVNPLN